MSPSNKSAKWIGFTTGFAAAVVGAVYAIPFINADAFASMKSKTAPLGGETGVRMEGVTMRSYEKGKLVSQAEVDRIDVRRDRAFFSFYEVHDGILFSENGNVNFNSDTATYDQIAQQLRFDAGVKLMNGDFNLMVPRLTLDEGNQTIQAPGPIKGTLKGGILQAVNFKYKLPEKEFMTGAFSWQGEIPGEVKKGVPVPQGKTAWNIEGRDSHGKGSIFEYSKARATDGEVIVKAPHIIQDRKTDILTCDGPVYYFSKKANLVADHAVVYRKEKRVLLTGNVRALVKPKDKPDLTETEVPPFRPDVPAQVADNRPEAPAPEEAQQQKDLDDALHSSKTIRDYPSMVKCDRAEYWYGDGNRHGLFTGSPEAFQDIGGGRWRNVSAFRGLYDGETEKLRLESSAEDKREVHVTTSIGDDIFAFWYTVSTKEDDDEWAGDGVKGHVVLDDDEVPKEKKTPPPTGGG